MIYYVGPGGSDTALGTSWATRLLTLNAAEDSHGGDNAKSAIAAGDTVYVAPGCYREMLTCDVSGSAGNTITYIGDVSGIHTDGIGGVVRITGSDNDQTATRNSCIYSLSKTYRTFRGFVFDTCVLAQVSTFGAVYDIVEDCVFGLSNVSSSHGLSFFTASHDCIVRRCFFSGAIAYDLYFSNSTAQDNANQVVQNCLFLGGSRGVLSDRVGGVNVSQCTFRSQAYGVQISVGLTAGQAVTINNCIFNGAQTAALKGISTGDIVEDYNSFYGNVLDRSTCNTGAHSVAYASLLEQPVLYNGLLLPWVFGRPSAWSAIRAIAGTGMLADDLFGLTRPATDSKKSWGAIQYQGQQRSSAQAQAGSYSLNLADAGMVQFFVPTSAVPTTISVWVYREANYAGTNPQMIIRKAGQADTVITDAGAAGGWNLLTTTLTPAAVPGFSTVLLVSGNTATSGSYNVYFDGLAVS